MGNPSDIRVSLCMIVRDEEKRLPRCLESARPWVQEIVVVDTGSRDNTCTIARQFEATVVETDWGDDFSAPRNLSLDRATGRWILVLDADEILEVDSAEQWNSALHRDDLAGFVVPVVSSLTGNRTTTATLLRCFRNHPTVRYHGPFHERVDESLHRWARNQGAGLGHLPATIHHVGYQEHVVAERGKEARDRRLLERTLREYSHDPYLMFKVATHPLVFGVDRQRSRECLERSWNLLESLDAPTARAHVFAPEVAALLIGDLLREGLVEQAESLRRRADSRCEPSVNLRTIGARLLALTDCHDPAIREWSEVLPLFEKPSWHAPWDGVNAGFVLCRRSESRYVLGDREGARADFEAAKNFDSKSANAVWGDVSRVLADDDVGRCVTVLRQRIQRAPQDRQAWERGRDLLLAWDQPQKAQVWWRAAEQSLAR